MNNFKFYKSGSLIILIATLLILAQLIINVFGPIISNALPNSIKNEILSIVDYIGVFSVIGIASLCLLIINKWGWKWKFRNWRVFDWLVDLPDLSGRYIGHLMSDYNGGTKKRVALEIKQTASSIKINSYFADLDSENQTSYSYSIAEEIIKGHDDIFSIHFLYTNEPDIMEKQLNFHGGTMALKYFPDVKTLKGDYYNKRKNTGTLNVVYVTDQCLGRFN